MTYTLTPPPHRRLLKQMFKVQAWKDKTHQHTFKNITALFWTKQVNAFLYAIKLAIDGLNPGLCVSQTCNF